MVWSFIALVLTPLGLLANSLLLSGWTRAESLGSRICSLSIYVGNLCFQLDKICVLFASVVFAREAWRAHQTEEGALAEALSASLQDRARMTRWRHERNYWISLYVLTLWAVAWRVNYLVKLTRARLVESAAPALTGELQEKKSTPAVNTKPKSN